MKFGVEPGPSPFRYQIADLETGSIYERDLTYEEALSICGRLNEQFD
jgi:hypothetical protein